MERDIAKIFYEIAYFYRKCSKIKGNKILDMRIPMLIQ